MLCIILWEYRTCIPHGMNIFNLLLANFFKGNTNVSTIHTIPLHSHDTDSWNPFSHKGRTYLYCIVNITGADVLVSQRDSYYHIVLQLVSSEPIKTSESDYRSLQKLYFSHKPPSCSGKKHLYNHNYIPTAGHVNPLSSQGSRPAGSFGAGSQLGKLAL